ncbi:MAG: VWA domain-containing protein [Pseudomonadota bacterium]|nr:VWA domain-containing protein [Pseudomonadota bacterium]
MSFLWPSLLWLLLLLPLLVALYAWLLTRRKKTPLRYSSLSLIKQAAANGPGWRRHVPPLLMLIAIATMLVATARPLAVIKLPSQQETIILAMDVSGSMRAADVQPNRLVAAQEAAKAFVAELPRSVRVGIVSFAGTAAVVQPPTHNRADVVEAIDRFQLQRGTAIGSGIVLSLATLFPDAGIDLSQVTGARSMPAATPPDNAPLGHARDGSTDKPAPEFTPVSPGSYGSGAIILLTDGQRTTGPDPLESARMAADRGVKVYSVGIGTRDGESISFEGWTMRVKLDEDTLKSISTMTMGEYFYAGTAADLKKVYQSLSTRLVVERKETEVSGLFAGAAALLVLLSAGLSVAWFGRVA